MVKTTRITLACVLCLFVFDSVSHAQTGNRKRGTRRNIALTTGDNWSIAATYYPSQLGTEAPVIILLHMKKSSRLVWDRGYGERGNEKKVFVSRLQNEGYAVVTVDLRKHGQSANLGGGAGGDASRLRARDYRNMVFQDLMAVKKFLYEEHQKKKLNMNKTAIIAPEMSAPIALHFAVLDWMRLPYSDAPTLDASTPRGQDIRAMVLISPDGRLAGVSSTGKALLKLRKPDWGVSFLIISGTGDDLDKGTAKKMYQRLIRVSKNKPRVYLKQYNQKRRGTDLFEKDIDIEEQILAFFDKHLKQLPSDWRDRESKLNQ